MSVALDDHGERVPLRGTTQMREAGCATDATPPLAPSKASNRGSNSDALGACAPGLVTTRYTQRALSDETLGAAV